MRTSLNKIKTIEELLSGTMAPAEQLVFEARQVVDQALANDVKAQRKTYEIIKACGRIELRHDLNELHHKLMNDPAKANFRDLILSIFKKR